MNYTIIPKSIRHFQTGNNFPTDIYVWAMIRCKSDYKKQTSHITEARLAQFTGVNERSIKRSIQRLKDCNAMEVRTRITDGFIRHNSYIIQNPESDFFFVDNGFFKKNYEPKIAGFLLLLKTICLNNTNTTGWNITRIASELHISRPTVSNLIKKCIDLGLIKELSDGYEITEDSFINPPRKDIAHLIYRQICEFCVKKSVTPPQWDKQWMDRIICRYNFPDASPDEPISIIYALNNRCKTLPTYVSLAYFAKALCNAEYIPDIPRTPVSYSF